MCRRVFTERPASLLWRFIAERASGRFSLASANSLDTSTPNSASSLQPPHFQPSPGGSLVVGVTAAHGGGALGAGACHRERHTC
ncbi:hypothetical protein CesoFtcFv8_022372 [Champsocephalus esox]|uniref:Uncharacterized protein n=1 Tax=Champsocephalus esox TaxID=159716 RepID=A0AAN8BBC5_9TELE|nr:hypothetical protein CesoFtcFv8_022372 [Champsocephalus esox]